ncbi:response regulator [Rhodovulum sp. DZ06]|uniref:response regulator n=1 Tax=Rhodovulum sp. DZ06 TaxID=3425126 RepID=UPI003D33AD42
MSTASQTPPHAATPSPAPAGSPGGRVPARPARVLVVDDDAWTRRTMTGHLVSEGLEVECAAGPEEAIRLWHAREGGFDLVFMDIRFPGGESGYDAALRLSRMDGTPPAIFGMTSFDIAGGDIDPKDFGMRELLVKPLFKWLVVNIARAHCPAADPPD